MIELEIAVVSDSEMGALQRGAIVTVAQLAGLKGEKILSRQTQTKVLDIVRNELHYSSFPVENPGIYEITVRSPKGTDWREVTLEKSEKFSFRVQSPRKYQDFLSTVTQIDFPQNRLPAAGNQPDFVGRQPNIGGRDVIANGRILNAIDFVTTRAISSPTFANFADLNLMALNAGEVVEPSIDLGAQIPRLSRSARISAPSFDQLNNVYFSLRGQPVDRPIPARWTNCFGRHGRDLVSIPWDWFPLIDEPDRQVEIRLELKDSRSGANTMLEVQDTKWGALLDFVTQGRMEDAARVADSFLSGAHIASGSLPEFALQGKLKEPLVAVLGGIILVSNVADFHHERWDPWLRNLANWFPNIPDAGAILGYRLLQRGKAEEARLWLERSINAGLPFFSATFRLLMLGFSQLQDRKSLDLISPAAAAIDVAQPFTVVHVPWGMNTSNPATTQDQG
jgi:hypothetical protein